jgi:glutamyl/glutaminyl-tRNA synthetase
MPFILNEDKSKLSKRQQGELVSLKYYREKGYIPEAMVNYLAFCGWNPGDETEIMSMEEIIKRFDIMKVQKAGAVFNPEKLLWINKEYIKKLPKDTILKEIIKRLPENYRKLGNIENVCSVLIERISVWSDIDKMLADGDIQYFFEEPKLSKEMIIWKKGGTLEQAKEYLSLSFDILNNISDKDFILDDLKEKLMPLAEEKGKGNVLWPLRVALSGREKSPDPFTLLFILGKAESLKRIQSAIDSL